MFEATEDMYKEEKSVIGRYLIDIGVELSDLMEISGVNVARSSFWNKNSNDMHGVYTLAPSKVRGGGWIIHVQAYLSMSEDASYPLLCAWLRDAPTSFNNNHDASDTTKIHRTLLEQDHYGIDPSETAKLIAAAYNS